MRITELLAIEQALILADMSRLQLDLCDLHALRLRELIAKTAEAQGFEHEAAAMRAWDGSTAPDSKEAALYFVWYRNLTQESVGHVASDRSSPVDRSPD
jgi:acyl-homoserine lactone acylase PvdQ